MSSALTIRSAAARRAAQTRGRMNQIARLCSCGAEPRPGQSECRACHAADMRARRHAERTPRFGVEFCVKHHDYVVGLLSEAA
jgi:hypothetical protein